jgi:hypothetical protein
MLLPAAPVAVLEHGDVLRTPARTPLLTGKDHFGVLDGEKRAVIHACEHGVMYVALREFVHPSGRLHVHHRPTPAERHVVVDRARSLLGQPYNLITDNCEHLATFAATGQAMSRQVRDAALAGVLGAAVIGLISAAANAPAYDVMVGRHRDRYGRFAPG